MLTIVSYHSFQLHFSTFVLCFDWFCLQLSITGFKSAGSIFRSGGSKTFQSCWLQYRLSYPAVNNNHCSPVKCITNYILKRSICHYLSVLFISLKGISISKKHSFTFNNRDKRSNRRLTMKTFKFFNTPNDKIPIFKVFSFIV